MKYDHISEHILKSHILPPRYRFLFSCTVWIHKCLMKEEPNCLVNFFAKRYLTETQELQEKGNGVNLLYIGIVFQEEDYLIRVGLTIH